MELQFYGANCIRLSTKKSAVVIDDTLGGIGLKPIAKADDVVLFTTKADNASVGKLIIDGPGEYETLDIAVQGIPARAHMDESDGRTATIFKVEVEDIRVAVVGHIYSDLSEDQLEALGPIDVLFVPVGNSGYTLDAIGAQQVIKAIEPKIVIPTHYADTAVKYEVPQQPLEEALKGLGMEVSRTVTKLKLKPADLPEATQLIVLERQ